MNSGGPCSQRDIRSSVDQDFAFGFVRERDNFTGQFKKSFIRKVFLAYLNVIDAPGQGSAYASRQRSVCQL
jgi:hypothetical protein